MYFPISYSQAISFFSSILPKQSHSPHHEIERSLSHAFLCKENMFMCFPIQDGNIVTRV